MNKQIANVVFYKFWDPTREDQMQQACIFYEDGTVKNVSHEEGLEAVYEIAKVDRIKTQSEFVKTLNTKRVFTLSGQEFEKRFKEFLGPGVALVPASSVKPAVTVNQVQENTTKIAPVSEEPVATATQTTPKIVPVNTVTPAGKPVAQPVSTPKEDVGKTATPVIPIVVPPVSQTAPTDSTTIPVVTPTETATDQESQSKSETENSVPPVIPVVVPPVTTAEQPVTPIISTPVATTQTPPQTQAEKAAANNGKKKKKKGLFSRLWTRITAIVLAIALAFTGGYHLGKNTKSGDIITNNITMESQDDILVQDRAYLLLLEKSTNEDQKAAMTHQGQSLDIFNRDFANAHPEEGKDIKASLTWDEMMALNLAYNNYSKEQIRIMFNGSEVDSTAMSNAYKNATLQLMGAYVISDRENPVNSSQFLIDEEQRAFVEKYNDLFLTMKEKTGAERVAAIDAFYAELYKDFPIADDVREVGISHADARQLVEPYKAAITPIVAAAEIMFQNTDGIDHTLSDKAIAYFNDLGLCNLVDEQFERAETITLAAEIDESQPLYEEFREAKIKELIYEGNYPTDDAHRDLSQLDEFQKWVNGHFVFEDGANTGKIVVNTTTRTEVTTYTETSTHTETTTHQTSDRNEAVSMAGEEAVKKAEAAVDQQIAAENVAAKAEAEKQAAIEAEKQQAAADAERKGHEEEVAKDDQEMQDMIEDANDTINQGGQVNEDDFGDHNVDFDDDYSDSNGNLDDSVVDITTDGSGAVDENEPLPDPNQTGAIFDSQASNASSTSYESSSYSTTPATETYQNTSGQEIYEYEEEYTGGLTNEELVDAYINSLEGQGANEEGYQYSK